jgi:hypothetical protein
MMTDQEIVEVVQAKIRGETIEAKRISPAYQAQYARWQTILENPLWDFSTFIYRKKVTNK